MTLALAAQHYSCPDSCLAFCRIWEPSISPVRIDPDRSLGTYRAKRAGFHLREFQQAALRVGGSESLRTHLRSSGAPPWPPWIQTGAFGTFSRHFTTNPGRAPPACIRRTKCKNAAWTSRQSSHSVRVLCAQCGYAANSWVSGRACMQLPPASRCRRLCARST